AESAENAEKMPNDVLCSSLRSQRPLRFNSSVESIVDCTIHAFAGHRTGTFFCPPFFCPLVPVGCGSAAPSPLRSLRFHFFWPQPIDARPESLTQRRKDARKTRNEPHAKD